MIRIVVPGDAVSFGTKNVAYRVGGNLVRGTRKTDSSANWEAEVKRCAAAVMNGREMLEGPIDVRWLAVMTRPKSTYRKRNPRGMAPKPTKPDKDKIERLILDGLAGVVYAADQQVVYAAGLKVLGAQNQAPMTIIEIRPFRLEDVDGAVPSRIVTGNIARKVPDASPNATKSETRLVEPAADAGR